MLIECTECKATYHPKGNIEHRETIRSGVVEYGLHCPNCNAWQHAYYDSTKLQMLRVKLNNAKVLLSQKGGDANMERFKRAKAEYSQAFDQLKREMEDAT